MERFNRFIASILTIGIFFSNVMPGQLSKALLADGNAKSALPQQQGQPPVKHTGAEKGKGARELPQQSGKEVKEVIVEERVVVTEGECKDLFALREDVFCDSQHWRGNKTDLDPAFHKKVQACYRLAYDRFIRGSIHQVFGSELASTRDKKGNENPEKANKAIREAYADAQKNTKKHLADLEERLALINRVAQVQDRENVFITAEERGVYFNYIDQVANEGGDSNYHYDMCVDYAKQGAVASYQGGSALVADHLSKRPEPSVQAGGQQYDRLGLCRKIYREGKEFFARVGETGFSAPDEFHNKMSIVNEDLARNARGKNESRASAKRFGDIYQANIDLAEACKNQEKVSKSSNIWLWLLLAGLIGLGIYLIFKKKHKDDPKKPNKPNKPKDPKDNKNDNWDCDEDCGPGGNNNNGGGDDNNNNGGGDNNNNGGGDNNNNGGGGNNNNTPPDNTNPNDWASEGPRGNSGRGSGSGNRPVDDQPRSGSNNSGRALGPKAAPVQRSIAPTKRSR
jgi:hypothetical protein